MIVVATATSTATQQSTLMQAGPKILYHITSNTATINDKQTDGSIEVNLNKCSWYQGGGVNNKTITSGFDDASFFVFFVVMRFLKHNTLN